MSEYLPQILQLKAKLTIMAFQIHQLFIYQTFIAYLMDVRHLRGVGNREVKCGFIVSNTQFWRRNWYIHGLPPVSA